MNERIKMVRQRAGLTMEAFGERIFLVKSMVSRMEHGDISPTDRTVDAICREFHVREEWLRTGEGEMYEADAPDNDIDRALQDCGATGLEADVIKAYLELSPELRKVFIDHFRDYFAQKGKASQGEDGKDGEPHDD